MNPILQVSQAPYGQYKYSGHIIHFPQDISMIAKKHPRLVKQLDYIIVRSRGVESRYYEWYMKRQCVMDVFLYKIQIDKYYRDVEIHIDSIVAHHERPTDVSMMLQHVDWNLNETSRVEEDIENGR